MRPKQLTYSFDAETRGEVRSGDYDKAMYEKLTNYFRDLSIKHGIFVGFIGVVFDGQNVEVSPENNWLHLDKSTIESEVKELILSHQQQ